jgi:hypothetical protein
MKTIDTMLEIQTLGHFSISVAGKNVATDWPDETVKLFFCSLLSPMVSNFTWDRICRTMWGVAVTRNSRLRLEEAFVRPMISFMIKELGFNPIISGDDGIRINLHNIHMDAFEFHSSVVEGLRLLLLGNQAAAVEKFSSANSLYVGSFLPGMPGKIIANTRNDLASLYRTNCSHGRNVAHSEFRLFGL